MPVRRDAHVVAAHTEGLAELQAFRDAMEPNGAPIGDQLEHLLDTAVAFFASALPMRALLLTDHELARDFRRVTSATGLGPQVPLVELAEWVAAEQDRGHVHAGVRPRAAAVAICGAANYLAALELLLPADLATTVAGDRGDVVALLLAGLTTGPAVLAVEP